jgi:hypothetical protein
MRGIYIVIAFLHVPTGEPVKDPISWRFRGVSLSECAALLSAEKKYDMAFIVQDDGSDATFRRTIVHRWRKMERDIEENWATSGSSVDVVLSCEEREVQSDQPEQNSDQQQSPAATLGGRR